jgi:putative FmdB family regulatory protein
MRNVRKQMPKYVYQCGECRAQRELTHSIHEDPIIECYMCDDSFMYRVVQTAGVAFNGSGFYSTDNKK